jgi:hypothetical protein
MLLALCLGCALAWRQTSAPRDTHPDVNLRAETTLVVIPVTVTDASNRYVLGLGKDNFSISEDGVKQKISQFAAEEAPLSIGLLVDTSGSMGAKLGTSRGAAAEILNTLTAEDEAFLVESIVNGWGRNSDTAVTRRWVPFASKTRAIGFSSVSRRPSV